MGNIKKKPLKKKTEKLAIYLSQLEDGKKNK